MASRIEVKKKTITKRDRSKSRGTAKRKKVTVRAKGRGMSYDDGSYAYPEENYVRPDGSYSRRRGRDAMGRYSSDEGSVDEHTKKELRKLIDQM